MSRHVAGKYRIKFTDETETTTQLSVTEARAIFKLMTVLHIQSIELISFNERDIR